MDHAVDFIEQLKRDLKPYLRQPMTDVTQDAIETTIAHRITEGVEHGENLIVFDGLQVTGGSVGFDENVVDGSVHWTHVAYGEDVTGSIADILDSDSYHDDTSERQKQIPDAIKKLTRGEARALGVETLWVRYHPTSADRTFNLD